MEAPAIRRRMTLSDQLFALRPPSSNLGDLLKFRDDATTSSRSTVSLATVLEAEKNTASTSSSGAAASRTLLDVIMEEKSREGGGGGESSSRWRDLTDQLRNPQAATWTARSTSASAREMSNSSSSADRSGSGRISLRNLLALREREDEGEEERGGAAVMAVAEVDDDDVDDEIWGRESQVCCVCTVRRKGAAFIPCGHTFCRVCARELLVGRGHCPLCNASILEVLHIF